MCFIQLIAYKSNPQNGQKNRFKNKKYEFNRKISIQRIEWLKRSIQSDEIKLSHYTLKKSFPPLHPEFFQKSLLSLQFFIILNEFIYLILD